MFNLFGYSTSWQLLNSSPNAHTLSLANLASNSIYGVLEFNSPLSVTLNAPGNLSISNSSSVTLNITAIDSQFTTMSCSIFLDGALSQTNASMSNNTATIFVVDGIADGSHTWYAQCNDGANNATSATSGFIVDTTVPVVTLNSPANLFVSNSSSVNFNFTAVDNLSSSMNCSLFLDGVPSQNNASTANNSATVLSVSGIADGFHSWSVQCIDNAGNIGASAVNNLTIDTSAPAVTLNAPANLSVFNVSSVAFNFTVVDNLSVTMNCSIFLDGSSTRPMPRR